MSQLIRTQWKSMLDAGLPRRDRSPCVYEAYVPDPLAGRSISLDGSVAADVSDAEAAIVRLNAEAVTLANTEALARILLRAESVASSRIEGLEIGGHRLLRAESARGLGEEPRDVTAAEVLGNIDAMVWAVQSVTEQKKISLRTLLEVHRRLLAGTRLEPHAGKIRTQQNWIGGSSYNPCSASFVPPPPGKVEALLEDLCAFCNTDGLPAVVQAAVAHAQFETIHPFVDGNGRTGRTLIHLVLRRRGLAVRVLPPVSLILATRSREYIDALTSTRYRGAPTSKQANDGLNRWIGVFASACSRAVADATEFERRILLIEEEWRRRLGSVRADSATDRLLRALPGAPVLTATAAASLVDRSFQAANGAVGRLLEAGILAPVNVGRRNRAFEAPDILAAFDDLERQLASPAGDTRVSRPARNVPGRRRSTG